MSRMAALLGLLLLITGCGDPVMNGLPAHRWDRQAVQTGPDGRPWPDWSRVEYQPVNLSQEADKAKQEYAAFAWDDTGIYGLIYGLAFPNIEITSTDKSGRRRTIVIDSSQAAPLAYRQSLGVLRARCPETTNKHMNVAGFRYVDRGWVGEAGQCQSEFWLSWSALPTNGREGKTLLTINGQKVCFPGH